METQPPIDRMQTPRPELRAITVSSDECAAECVESGRPFRGTDPENFVPYEAADAEYNDGEPHAGRPYAAGRTGISKQTNVIAHF